MVILFLSLTKQSELKFLRWSVTKSKMKILKIFTVYDRT